MALGKTPQNQLDALPLQDADTAAEGGSLQVIGGVLYRYFSASALGINLTAMATFGGLEQAVVTPYLDLRGCSMGTLALRTINNVAARAALPSIFILAQYRLGPSDTPAVVYTSSGGGRDDQDNGIVNLFTTGRVFAATTNPAESQTNVWSWGVGAGTGIVSSFFNAMGSDVRFIITTSTLGMSTNNLFSCNIWAQS